MDVDAVGVEGGPAEALGELADVAWPCVVPERGLPGESTRSRGRAGGGLPRVWLTSDM